MFPIRLKLGPFYWNPVDFNLRDEIYVLFTVLYKMLETQRWVKFYQNSITNPVGYYMEREGGSNFLTGPGEILRKTTGPGWRQWNVEQPTGLKTNSLWKWAGIRQNFEIPKLKSNPDSRIWTWDPVDTWCHKDGHFLVLIETELVYLVWTHEQMGFLQFRAPINHIGTNPPEIFQEASSEWYLECGPLLWLGQIYVISTSMGQLLQLWGAEKVKNALQRW